MCVTISPNSLFVLYAIHDIYFFTQKIHDTYFDVTGKTMIARILGKLLHLVGILPTDKVTEVQRTDLVGEFVGHTGPKTRRKVLYYYVSIFCYHMLHSLWS